MNKKAIILPITISLTILALIGCTRVPVSTAPKTASLVPGESSATVYPLTGIAPTPIYPLPGNLPIPIYPTPDTSSSFVYPSPGTPGAVSSNTPTSFYEPKPGDENLQRDSVQLDLANSRLVMNPTEPVQAVAILTGSNPDPCHSLRVIVTPADAQSMINLEVYSLVDPTLPCVTVLSEFSASIPLGGYAAGVYSVVVNGELLDQFDTSYAPKPSGYEPQIGDENLKRESVTLDVATSQLVVTGSKPVQVTAILAGSVPDACHSLRVKMDPPDAGGTITLNIYSVFDPNKSCTSKVVPFNVNISLGSFISGQYTVLASGAPNGLLGQFDASFAPQPGDGQLMRGEVTLDMSLTQLATTGTGSDVHNLPAVNIQGSLPDSCYQLRIVFNPAYDNNRVDLEVYSLFDPQTVCTNVAQPFQVTYPLAGAGQSSVFVNGQFVGKFDWGG